MPIAAAVSSSSITETLLSGFIIKIKGSSVKDEKAYWENDLKWEAKRIFTLIPLNDLVFKELESLSNNIPIQGVVNCGSLKRKSKKSLIGSGSFGSINNMVWKE